jgi:hypothetical protein
VLRGASVDAILAAGAKWVDLQTPHSRAHRLTNFYEPVLSIWLERTVNLSAAGASGYSHLCWLLHAGFHFPEPSIENLEKLRTC